MIKKSVFLWPWCAFIVIALSGCATVSQATSRNRENLLKLSVGMSKEEAIRIMGTKKFSAGNIVYNETPVTINNPYRSETTKSREEGLLEVIYYVTDVKRNDNLITDDELTPLVFADDKLIGWGWMCLEENKKVTPR